MATFKFTAKMGWAVMFTLFALCGLSRSSIAKRTEAAQARVLRVAAASGMAGGSVAVAVELVAQGNENAIGFSLNFNPAQLANPQTVAGGGTGGASLNVNALQSAQGRLGLAMAQPAGQTFAAGTRQLVVVTFSIPANAVAGTAQINFGDGPVTREIVDVNANPLQTSYTGGAVSISAQTPVASVSAASFSGRNSRRIRLSPRSAASWPPRRWPHQSRPCRPRWRARPCGCATAPGWNGSPRSSSSRPRRSIT